MILLEPKRVLHTNKLDRPFQNAASPGRYILCRGAGTVEQETQFRIRLTVAVYKDKKLVYRNDMTVPTRYRRRSEARAHVKKEIQDRLKNSNFFISPRVDFDLVRYTQEASCNTYLRYRIIEDADTLLPAENALSGGDGSSLSGGNRK